MAEKKFKFWYGILGVIIVLSLTFFILYLLDVNFPAFRTKPTPPKQFEYVEIKDSPASLRPWPEGKTILAKIPIGTRLAISSTRTETGLTRIKVKWHKVQYRNEYEWISERTCKKVKMK